MPVSAADEIKGQKQREDTDRLYFNATKLINKSLIHEMGITKGDYTICGFKIEDNLYSEVITFILKDFNNNLKPEKTLNAEWNENSELFVPVNKVYKDFNDRFLDLQNRLDKISLDLYGCHLYK